jgi:hypothetical protein
LNIKVKGAIGGMIIGAIATALLWIMPFGPALFICAVPLWVFFRLPVPWEILDPIIIILIILYFSIIGFLTVLGWRWNKALVIIGVIFLSLMHYLSFVAIERELSEIFDILLEIWTVPYK